MIQMQASHAADVIGATLAGADREFVGCGTDSRTIEPHALFVALHGPSFDGHAFVDQAAERGAAVAMVQDRSQHAIPTLQVSDTLSGLARLAGAWRDQFRLPVVAITGSNGKTTVKDMVAAILAERGPCLATRGNLNNEIGVPLTLLELTAAVKSAVIELGANHPGEIARLSDITKPDIGVITQCAPAHLEGFGDELGVARAKGELFEKLGATGTAVINADDRYSDYWRGITEHSARVTFGFSKAADVSATWEATAGGSQVLLTTPTGKLTVALSLPGKHNVLNAAAAAAAAIALDVDADQIVTGLESVRPAKGRLQLKPGARDTCIIDDSYNANPCSLAAGLAVLAEFSPPRWLVLGEMAELGARTETFHRQAGELARERGIDRLFAVGNLTRYTVDAFGNGARHFADQSALIADLCEHLPDAATILVKGSRSMHMERVVSALTVGA